MLVVQGTGGFGTVYRGVWRGKDVAVKCLPNLAAGKTNDGQYEALVREIELSTKFNSNRLVRVLGACVKDRSSICLIMELVEGGNLFQRIHNPLKPRLTAIESLKVSLATLDSTFRPELWLMALAYHSSQGSLGCDLKVNLLFAPVVNTGSRACRSDFELKKACLCHCISCLLGHEA